MVLAGKIRIVLKHSVRLVEKTETDLQTEHAAHRIVNTLHRNLSLLHKLLKVDCKLAVVRNHRHVDTGIYSQPDSILERSCNTLTGIEVVDVSPVSHYHSVPVQLLLHPLGQKFCITVKRHTVVAGRIDHDRKSACLHSLLERLEMFLTEFRRRN